MKTKYETAAANVFATASVPDGYFGDRVTCQLAMLDGMVVEVYPFGFCRSSLPDVVDVHEAKWLLENHPEGKRRYKNLKMKG